MVYSSVISLSPTPQNIYPLNRSEMTENQGSATSTLESKDRAKTIIYSLILLIFEK